MFARARNTTNFSKMIPNENIQPSTTHAVNRKNTWTSASIEAPQADAIVLPEKVIAFLVFFFFLNFNLL